MHIAQSTIYIMYILQQLDKSQLNNGTALAIYHTLAAILYRYLFPSKRQSFEATIKLLRQSKKGFTVILIALIWGLI